MINFKPLPHIESLWENYKIDPLSPSGLSRIKASKGRNGRLGPVMSLDADGYWRTKLKGEHYRVHRIIYCMHSGIDPGPFIIDHKDGNPRNNEVENLRLSTAQQNIWNSKGRHKKSGLPKGIDPIISGGYTVKISIKRKPQAFKTPTLEEAIELSKTLRELHHGPYAKQ